MSRAETRANVVIYLLVFAYLSFLTGCTNHQPRPRFQYQASEGYLDELDCLQEEDILEGRGM